MSAGGGGVGFTIFPGAEVSTNYRVCVCVCDKCSVANCDLRFGAVVLPFPPSGLDQGKTKGQQLKGKIVSEFFTFFALFHTFSEFSPQDFPFKTKG